MKNFGSKDICSVAIKIAITNDREEEKKIQRELLNEGIKTAAVDYGGEFNNSITKMIERAVVSAKREHVIESTHIEEGSVAGAAHEALTQITYKALGLNIGGKIGIARYNDHLAVAVYFGIGLLHLNDVSIGLAHRVI